VPAFLPQIRVASNGTVALTYYGLQNATAAQPGLSDVFIASCSTNCSAASSWASSGQTRLTTTGSFDYTTAPNAGGLFIGDYQGLAVANGKILPFFIARPTPSPRPDAPTPSSPPPDSRNGGAPPATAPGLPPQHTRADRSRHR
jgi:hypothetical protein